MRITLSLGRYQIVKHLSSGDLTEVRLGQRIGPKGIEHHVLHWLCSEHVEDDELACLFFDQARLAAYLRHPNIAGIVEVVDHPGLDYIATEYVHGEELGRLIARVRQTGDQVPIALVAGLVDAAAAGLHHAHSLVGPERTPLGIVHGGVSPSSIVVGYDGLVRMTGFGLAAAALRAAARRPAAYAKLAPYLSPEQVTERPVIDARADVFALGAVMYELATGRRLFRGEHAFLTMSAIAHGEVPRPSRFRTDLPRALEDIIMKALATAPEERFQSAQELRAALAAFALSVGMRISQASIADYMKKLFGTRPLPWTVGERVGVAAVAAAARGQADQGGDGDAELGVATAPAAARLEFELPASARRSTTAPIVRAKQDLLGAPAPAPAGRPTGEGAPSEVSRTPMSWATQPVPKSARLPRRTLALVVGVTMAASIASFFAVGMMVRGGGGSAAEVAPAVQPPPPPPPAIEVTPLPEDVDAAPIEPPPAAAPAAPAVPTVPTVPIELPPAGAPGAKAQPPQPSQPAPKQQRSPRPSSSKSGRSSRRLPMS